jgi:acetyltransferase-like isoleucine patch superfamily enzyme
VGEARRLRPDWHPGTIPANVVADPTAYVGTSYSFLRFRSREPVGLRIGRAATLADLTILDVGPRGRIVIGDYALVNGALILCDGEVTIGDHVLIGWDVVLMDTYRVPFDVVRRRHALERVARERPRRLATDVPSRPIRIARNVWIGFEACVLPGVRIGEGAVVGARAVVTEDVPPGAVVAGNPARVVRWQTPA